MYVRKKKSKPYSLLRKVIITVVIVIIAVIIFSITFNIINSTRCSTFVKTFGGKKGDYIKLILQTNDKKYILFSTTLSNGSGQSDILITKINNKGDKIWENKYGWEGDEAIRDAILLPDEKSMIICGSTSSFDDGYCDGIVFKTDQDGKIVWKKIIGDKNIDEKALKIIRLDDGNFLVLGGFFYKKGMGMFWIKIDINGNILWFKKKGNNKYNIKPSSITKINGNKYILVSTIIEKGNNQIYLLKIDSNGNEIEEKILNFNKKLYIQNMIYNSIENTFLINSSLGQNIYLLKLDDNYNIIWSRLFSETQTTWGASMIKSSDNNYVITCGNKEQNVLLFKIDNNGQILWFKNYYRNSNDEGKIVLETFDKGYIIGAWTYSDNNGYDILIIKTDNVGNCPELDLKSK